MYVIRIVATATSAGATVAGRIIGSSETSTFYLPADRCSWQITTHTGGGYEISGVRFYAGTPATGEDISATITALSTVNASFGYIGKSGRFVELAQ